MAGQHPSRRQVLEALGVAAIAATADGFCRWNWAFAQTAPHHHHVSSVATPATHSGVYRPVFFTTKEYPAVEVLAEMILPATPPQSTAGPAHGVPARHRVTHAADAGATDAGVAEFIDFMVSQDASLQPGFRSGLHWLNEAAGAGGFVALPATGRVALLERVAYKKNWRDEDKAGQAFFALMRKYTVFGFYTSRIGLESLDYPGLRFYAESPAVPRDAFLQGLGV